MALAYDATRERIDAGEGVVFEGKDGDKVVRFLVSREAIEDLTRSSSLSQKELLEGFRAHRAAILQAAQTIYTARGDGTGPHVIKTSMVVGT